MTSCGVLYDSAELTFIKFTFSLSLNCTLEGKDIKIFKCAYRNSTYHSKIIHIIF